METIYIKVDATKELPKKDGWYEVFYDDKKKSDLWDCEKKEWYYGFIDKYTHWLKEFPLDLKTICSISPEVKEEVKELVRDVLGEVSDGYSISELKKYLDSINL